MKNIFILSLLVSCGDEHWSDTNAHSSRPLEYHEHDDSNIDNEEQSNGYKRNDGSHWFGKEYSGIYQRCQSRWEIRYFRCDESLTLAPDVLTAIKGADKIGDEMADLNGEEKDLLLAELKNCVFKLVEALV